MPTKTKVKIKGIKFRVPLIIEPDTIGFHVYSPALKGLHVDGDTEAEALKFGREAARLHLEAMIEDGDPIPLSIVEMKETKPTGKSGKNYHVVAIRVDCK